MLRATVTELEIELARYEHREPSHTRTLVVDEGGAETALSETEEDAEAVVERLLAGNAPALPVLKPVPTRLSLPAPEPEPEPAPEPEPKPAPPPSPEPELASAPEPEPAPPPEATPLLAGARSLAAAALHAAAEMQAQVRALEQTPEPEPQPAPEPAPEPAPAPVLPPASVTAPFQITVRRGSRGLGLRVNSSNIITELTAGGQAAQEGQLAVGDLVVAVDGVPMYDVAKGIRPLTEVLSNMPVKDDYRFEHTAYKSPAQQARGGRGGACLNVSLQSRTPIIQCRKIRMRETSYYLRTGERTVNTEQRTTESIECSIELHTAHHANTVSTPRMLAPPLKP